mmetsp:Transcript_1902/g.4278  ORF Transcript_1902/g.4278 Transcript_1902/m.4278 type:complete len:454 (+) Transcript_1902:94-1455(+)
MLSGAGNGAMEEAVEAESRMAAAQGSALLARDLYLEPDDVREVQHINAALAPALLGDFYHEPDNVTRGVMLGGPQESFGGMTQEPFGAMWQELGPGIGSIKDGPSASASLLDLGLARPGLGVAAKPAASAQEGEHLSAPAFSASSPPPGLAIGDEAATSIFLEGVSAAEVAGCVYAFLSEDVTASIMKVRPEKFAIKATVFREVAGSLLHCVLKVRVFRVLPRQEDTTERLVVDFCRRQGDALAFSDVFSLASRRLRSRLGQLPEEAEPVEQDHAAQGPLPTPLMQDECSLDSLGPLADMLADGSSPAGQAEAVATLAALASASTASAVAICTALANFQGVLVGLLAHAHTDVSYPAARLASEMARHGDCDVSETLLVAALESSAADTADRLVRLELAEAVHRAALRCGEGRPPARSPKALRGALAEALRRPACNEAAVGSLLHEALSVLEAF